MEEIAYTNNATDSYTRALSSIPLKKDDVILTTSNDYSSNQIAFLHLKKKLGIRIVKARDLENGEVDLDDLSDKLEKHRPKLVAVTHIPTNSGLVQPAEQIGDILENSDSLFLLDACQTGEQFLTSNPTIDQINIEKKKLENLFNPIM